MMRLLLKALGAYALYEALLHRSVKRGEIPKHIAVILDGNRRWARLNGLSVEEGYRAGARRVEDLLRWCLDLGVNTVTLYVLSLENIARRPKEEVETVYKILVEFTRALPPRR